MHPVSSTLRTILIASLFVAALALPASAGAATITVTSSADDGSPGTLRDAIDNVAAPGDSITFDPSVTSITLAMGQIQITDDVTIDGAGDVTINGDDASRIIEVTAGVVELDGLTFTEGLDSQPGGAGMGGAVLLSAGQLTIHDCSFVDNHVDGDDALGGALAAVAGTIELEDTVFDSNSATASGSVVGGAAYLEPAAVTTTDRLTFTDNEVLGPGAGFGGALVLGSAASFAIRDSEFTGNSSHTDGTNQGGAIHALGVIDIEGSTFSGNDATSDPASSAEGGAVYGSNDMTIENSTFTANTLSGLVQDGAAFITNAAGGTASTASHVTVVGNTGAAAAIDGPVTVDRSIVLQNSTGSQCSGTTSGGFNLVAAGGCGALQPSDVTSTNARLGTLADNGGETRTMLPSPWSPAIDVATCGAIVVDQRGTARPLAASCDAGAVEAAAPGTAAGPASSSFGSRDIAAGGANSTVTFSNAGPGPVGGPIQASHVAISGPNAAEFTVAATGDTCSDATVASASSCAIVVTFDPADVGSRTATLSVTFSSGTVAVPLDGTGTTPAPACTDQAVTMNPGRTASVTVGCANDATAWELLDTAPEGWSASITAGVATFVAPDDRLDDITLRYRASNKGGTSNTATFTIDVQRVQRLTASLVAPKAMRVLGKPFVGRCSVDIGDIRRCTLVVRSGRTVVARRTVRVGGERSTVVVRTSITRAGRRLVTRTVGGIRARATITVRTADGKVDAATRTIRLVPIRHVVLPPREAGYAGGSAVPTKAGRRFLLSLAAKLRGAPIKRITCIGHSAAFRTDFGSSALGRARARQACDLLRSRGVRAGSFAVNGKDASFAPRAGNGDEYSRGLNRRVDVIVTYR